ncbi:MAG TPA: hypothetical protein VH395_18020 [Jatrophihabitantaceae bacterium]
MALYQYDLYLVRERHDVPLFDELARAGLVQPGRGADASVMSLGGTHAFANRVELQLGTGRVLEVAALMIDDQDVRLMTRDFDAFVAWLDAVARATDLLTAFMPGGPDTAAGKPGEHEYLTALFEEGRVTVAHALMWFASDLASGALCAATGAPYRKIVAPGLGCLFALVDVAADGSFEILEPGSDRGHLLTSWRRGH